MTRVLQYHDSVGDFKVISNNIIPLNLRDSIQMLNKEWGIKKDRIIVFENTSTKSKYIFSFFSKEEFFYLSCDSLWNDCIKTYSLGYYY